jgi:hypothetical protein
MSIAASAKTQKHSTHINTSTVITSFVLISCTSLNLMILPDNSVSVIYQTILDNFKSTFGEYDNDEQPNMEFQVVLKVNICIIIEPVTETPNLWQEKHEIPSFIPQRILSQSLLQDLSLAVASDATESIESSDSSEVGVYSEFRNFDAIT